MKIQIAEDIRIPYSEFGAWRYQLLDEALSFKNPDRDLAFREMLPGAHLVPKKIHLVYRRGEDIIVPRGYLPQLLEGSKGTGISEFSYDNQTVSCPIDTRPWEVPNLREDQIPAVLALIEHGVGCFKGPTASGKTVVVLEAIRCAEEKAIVIVNRSDLARQWVQRAKDFLGVEPGLFGAGKNEIDSPITIAMQQTLWSQRDWLAATGFFKKFGFVCVDETHHVKAETYLDIVSRFPARYRIGVSATPDHNPDLYPLVEAMVGPVVYEITPNESASQGVILKGSVVALNTGFEFADYISTHHPDDCEGPECPRYGETRVHRNNYSEVINTLIADPERNVLIAQTIMGCDSERSHIVVSRRLKHLDAILDTLLTLGYPPDLVMRLTGKETTSEREEVKRRVGPGTVLLSTLADEGLDIPRLDTIHLVFPGRNPEVTRQQVGRIRRRHDANGEGKMDPLVFDYVDGRVGPMMRQYYNRKSKFYNVEGMEVEIRG